MTSHLCPNCGVDEGAVHLSNCLEHLGGCLYAPPYDPITRPQHYVKGRRIEPINVIEDWQLPYHLACVIKYLARYGRKEGEGSEGLKKAQYYLKRFIESQ